MPAKLNKDEKIALIGMCKFIINADGIVTDAEIESMYSMSEELGFDDYSEIFDSVDEKIFTLDDLKDYIDNLKDSSNKIKILKYAIQISRSDANIQHDEIDIIRYAADAWELDIKKIMGL